MSRTVVGFSRHGRRVRRRDRLGGLIHEYPREAARHRGCTLRAMRRAADLPAKVIRMPSSAGSATAPSSRFSTRQAPLAFVATRPLASAR